MKEFIDRLALNHDKKNLWMNYEDVDEFGQKITFLAPYFPQRDVQYTKLALMN
jgi:hypothetical protein